MKLENHVVIEGRLVWELGGRIGGTKDAVGIGETDNPIIRDPITRRPYVPGSSLKGKLRSLLEQKYSPNSQETGKPCACGKCFICRMFGCGDVKTTRECSRLIFRDCPLEEESAKRLEEALPGSFVEVKTEIAMDRNRGATRSGSLRQMERVPAGTAFNFEVTMRVFEGDPVKEHLERLAEAIALLEKEYLGGSGTRGYGKVRFLTRDGKQSLAEHIRSLSQATKA